MTDKKDIVQQQIKWQKTSINLYFTFAIWGITGELNAGSNPTMD